MISLSLTPDPLQTGPILPATADANAALVSRQSGDAFAAILAVAEVVVPHGLKPAQTPQLAATPPPEVTSPFIPKVPDLALATPLAVPPVAVPPFGITDTTTQAEPVQPPYSDPLLTVAPLPSTRPSFTVGFPGADHGADASHISQQMPETVFVIDPPDPDFASLPLQPDPPPPTPLAQWALFLQNERSAPNVDPVFNGQPDDSDIRSVPRPMTGYPAFTPSNQRQIVTTAPVAELEDAASAPTSSAFHVASFAAQHVIPSDPSAPPAAPLVTDLPEQPQTDGRTKAVIAPDNHVQPAPPHLTDAIPQNLREPGNGEAPTSDQEAAFQTYPPSEIAAPRIHPSVSNTDVPLPMELSGAPLTVTRLDQTSAAQLKVRDTPLSSRPPTPVLPPTNTAIDLVQPIPSQQTSPGAYSLPLAEVNPTTADASMAIPDPDSAVSTLTTGIVTDAKPRVAMSPTMQVPLPTDLKPANPRVKITILPDQAPAPPNQSAPRQPENTTAVSKSPDLPISLRSAIPAALLPVPGPAADPRPPARLIASPPSDPMLPARTLLKPQENFPDISQPDLAPLAISGHQPAQVVQAGAIRTALNPDDATWRAPVSTTVQIAPTSEIGVAQTESGPTSSSRPEPQTTPPVATLGHQPAQVVTVGAANLAPLPRTADQPAPELKMPQIDPASASGAQSDTKYPPVPLPHPAMALDGQPTSAVIPVPRPAAEHPAHIQPAAQPASPPDTPDAASLPRPSPSDQNLPPIARLPPEPATTAREMPTPSGRYRLEVGRLPPLQISPVAAPLPAADRPGAAVAPSILGPDRAAPPQANLPRALQTTLPLRPLMAQSTATPPDFVGAAQTIPDSEPGPILPRTTPWPAALLPSALPPALPSQPNPSMLVVPTASVAQPTSSAIAPQPPHESRPTAPAHNANPPPLLSQNRPYHDRPFHDQLGRPRSKLIPPPGANRALTQPVKHQDQTELWAFPVPKSPKPVTTAASATAQLDRGKAAIQRSSHSETTGLAPQTPRRPTAKPLVHSQEQTITAPAPQPKEIGLNNPPLQQSAATPPTPIADQITPKSPAQTMSHPPHPQPIASRIATAQPALTPLSPADQPRRSNSDPQTVTDTAPTTAAPPLTQVPAAAVPFAVLPPAPQPDHLVTPREARHLPQGLAPSIARAAARVDKDDRVELTLDPVELGKLRFDFNIINDRMQVNISVERTDTLDLLRRHAEVLRAEFRDAGFDGSTLSFSQWAQKDRNDTPQPMFSEGDADSLPAAAAPNPAPMRNLSTTGQGLDLRL